MKDVTEIRERHAAGYVYRYPGNDLLDADRGVLLAAVDERDAEIAQLRAALEFYADPEQYHAVSFMFDPPCGGFPDDFSDDHGHPHYDRPMPGATARRALTGEGT